MEFHEVILAQAHYGGPSLPQLDHTGETDPNLRGLHRLTA
jgi:hypothetical protein